MGLFKADGLVPREGILPEGFTLRRMSWLQRTVRYEWPGVDADGKPVTYYSATFAATLQEWERAHE